MNEQVSKLDGGKSVEKEEIELDDESFSWITGIMRRRKKFNSVKWF